MAKARNIYIIISLVLMAAFVITAASSFYVYEVKHEHDHMSPNPPKAGSLLVDIWESVIGKDPDQVVCYRESHRNFYLFCFFALAIILILIVLGLINQRRYSKSLLLKNTLIQGQSREIERQNEDIRAGLRYAGLIQQAFFPSESELRTWFTGGYAHTIKPKDQVGGDFIWARSFQNTKIICLGDCTGHGISAGLLTITCLNLLDKIWNELKPDRPSIFLNELKTSLKLALANSSLEDGVAISIVFVDGDQLWFSGSKQDLWLETDGEWQEVKGSRNGIGKIFEEIAEPFKDHKIQFNPANKILLFTDGLTDQMGGEAGKKLGKKNLRSWLEDSKQESVPGINKVILEKWNVWKNKEPQVDDAAWLIFEK